jgi:hypothetical protein
MSEIDPPPGSEAGDSQPGQGINPDQNVSPPPREPRAEPLWIRALYMLLFAVIANALVGIYLAACLLQLIVLAVSEKPNVELRDFLRSVLAYIGVTLGYLAFLDDQKPFPFSPLPHPEQNGD